MKKTKELARIEFAHQLKAYRKVAGISQENLAKAMGVAQPYIAIIEKAELGIGIDNMAEISACFGIRYFDFANPDYPIPSRTEILNNLKKYLSAKGIDPSYLEDERAPSYTKKMDVYLSVANLSEPKSSYDIAEEYNAMFDDVTITPSKVTDIFSHYPRKRMVEKIPTRKGEHNLYRFRKDKD